MNRMEHLLLDQQNQQLGMNGLAGYSSGYLQHYLSPYQTLPPYQTLSPCQTIVEREPASFEIKVQKCGNQIRMDYGAGLRILMADPFKGIDLREAVQKLKEALERI